MGGSSGGKRPLWVPVSVIGGGFLLFLFAASGGISFAGLPLRIEDNIWKLILSGAGLVLVAIGVLLLADERTRGAEPPVGRAVKGTADCQIRILRPARYHRQMVVEGGYLNRPPEGSLRLFTVMEDGRFMPQSIAEFDEVNKRWSGKVDLGPGPYYSVYVAVAFVGSTGMALWDYYFQVGRQTNWEPIAGPFADYATECDRFLVEGVINE
jgi:hypothetical protein